MNDFATLTRRQKFVEIENINLWKIIIHNIILIQRNIYRSTSVLTGLFALRQNDTEASWTLSTRMGKCCAYRFCMIQRTHSQTILYWETVYYISIHLFNLDRLWLMIPYKTFMIVIASNEIFTSKRCIGKEIFGLLCVQFSKMEWKRIITKLLENCKMRFWQDHCNKVENRIS